MTLTDLLCAGRRDPVVLPDEMRRALTIENIMALLRVCEEALCEDVLSDADHATRGGIARIQATWAVNRATDHLRELLP